MKRQVRLSTKRYSRANCGFACAELEIRTRNAYFIQLSKSTRYDHQLPIGTSPRQAERETGLEPASRILHCKKKPGDERRANPSYSEGRR
jgi:hypothetical protein